MSEDDVYALRACQGRIQPLVDFRIDEEAGGELQVRGPFIARDYYNDETSREKFTEDGWLRTGDVAELRHGSYIQLVDRTKDLVKSGGEWISSVELENEIMAHPDVLEAAVIAVPDEKWSERPCACVVIERRRRRSTPTACARSSTAAWPSGGCPTASSSSTRCPRRRWASSTRRSCAPGSPSAALSRAADTLVVSDLHLGQRARAPTCCAAPSCASALLAALEGVDELVLLGDVLELRDGPAREALRRGAAVLRGARARRSARPAGRASCPATTTTG